MNSTEIFALDNCIDVPEACVSTWQTLNYRLSREIMVTCIIIQESILGHSSYSEDNHQTGAKRWIT